MRIIAGTYRSRPLRSLRGMDIRPTSDRLRETLFNVLCAGNPGALAGTVWLDLFAGTGAVGIEALSRGAARVIFVDSSFQAASVIEKNLGSLQLNHGFQVLKTDAITALRKIDELKPSLDFVFLDPPYRMTQAYSQTLNAVSTSPAVSVSTIVVAEHDKKFDPGNDFGPLHRYRKLEQGDAALSFYRRGRPVKT